MEIPWILHVQTDTINFGIYGKPVRSIPFVLMDNGHYGSDLGPVLLDLYQ